MLVWIEKYFKHAHVVCFASYYGISLQRPQGICRIHQSGVYLQQRSVESVCGTSHQELQGGQTSVITHFIR